MKVIIAGSRDILDEKIVEEAILKSGFAITEVICGEARGVDTLGKYWAVHNKIPIKSFPANWNTFGKSAGFKRNQEMVEYADALIAVTNGSKGTAHTINLAKQKKIPMFVKYI